jgi:Tfp pilus assembly protein PilX
MRTSEYAGPHLRRGAAVLSFVVALLVIGTLVLWLFQLTAVSSMATLGHYYSTGAFYAAESGVELALRELGQANDIDSDGTIGTISDNGNDADDPSLVTGAVHVSSPAASTYEATGRPAQSAAPWSDFRRVIEAQAQ